MKAFKKSCFAVAALVFGFCFAACEDAHESEDANTSNPAWAGKYNDSYWVRGTGMKFDSYGEEIQGYVESLDFVDETYVVVKMSEGVIPASIKNTATWLDDSNTEAVPQYEYTYSPNTGNFSILKLVKDDSGKVSKVTVFTGVAVSEGRDIVTISHFGDTPVQTYLVKGQK